MGKGSTSIRSDETNTRIARHTCRDLFLFLNVAPGTIGTASLPALLSTNRKPHSKRPYRVQDTDEPIIPKQPPLLTLLAHRPHRPPRLGPIKISTIRAHDQRDMYK